MTDEGLVLLVAWAGWFLLLGLVVVVAWPKDRDRHRRTDARGGGV
jgi:hypothetical protein